MAIDRKHRIMAPVLSLKGKTLEKRKAAKLAVRNQDWVLMQFMGLGGCGDGGGVTTYPANRKITVTADMFVLDDEALGSNESARAQKTNSAILSGIGVTQTVMDFDVRMGGEIRVEFHVTAALADPYGNILLDAEVKLFEGASESTTDLDGSKQFQLNVPVGQTTNYFVRVDNDDEGGDYATIALSATNSAL